MRFLMVVGLLAVSVNVVSQALDPKADGQSLFKVEPATASRTLEDMALTYLREIANIDQNYQGISGQLSSLQALRDRDGFTDAQANEILDMARTLQQIPSQAEQAKSVESQRKLCAELGKAANLDEARFVLESRNTKREAELRSRGASLLAELKPPTRAKLMKVLEEYRGNSEVTRIEWKNATAEQLQTYKNRMCAFIS